MAFPLDLPPSVGFNSFSMELVMQLDTAKMEGRRTEDISFGENYWKSSFKTPRLNEEQMGDIEAFAIQGRTSGGCFLCYDVMRPRPRKSPDALADGAGGKTSTYTITSPTTVDITGMPSGFELSAGDKMGFYKSDLVRSVHIVVEATTFSGAGAGTVTFQTAVSQSVFDDTGEIHFEKPSCVMKVNDDFDLPLWWEHRQASFTATEVFFE